MDSRRLGPWLTVRLPRSPPHQPTPSAAVAASGRQLIFKVFRHLHLM